MLLGHLRVLGTLQTPCTELWCCCAELPEPPCSPSRSFCLQGEREEEKSRLELSLHLLAELRAKCQITSDTAPKGRTRSPGAPLISGGTYGGTGSGAGSWTPAFPRRAEWGDGWLGVPLPRLAGRIPTAAPETFLRRFPWKRGIFFSPKLSCLPALSAQLEPLCQSPTGRWFGGSCWFGWRGTFGRVCGARARLWSWGSADPPHGAFLCQTRMS